MWRSVKPKDDNSVLADEEYDGKCRVTLEKCGEHCEITCGIYGDMVHTIFCSEDKARNTYNNAKKDLQRFLDSNPSGEEKLKFYQTFTAKY